MSTEQPITPPAPAAAVAEDRTVAILSYITLIGFIAAIIIHSSKKTQIGAFHLRQALGLWITGFVGGIVLAIIPVLGWILLPVLWLMIVIFAIMGLIAAINGNQKPLPLLGSKYQQWFSGAFT